MTSECLDDETALAVAQGQLSPGELAELEEHVAACDDCRTVVAETAKYFDNFPEPMEASELRSSGKEHAGSVPATGLRRAGDVVSRYELLGVLGAGAVGVVYRAVDPQLRREVALKLLRPDRTESSRRSELATRLKREAQAMAQLSHPNVVAIYDVGEVDTEVFFTMELVQGATASAWLREKSRSHAEILELYIRAGRGLAAAHEVGLVHRDFKPENVLVDKNGWPKVTDFGLARAYADPLGAAPQLDDMTYSSLSLSLTSTQGILGTPAYMAPEQFLRADSKAQTDQFAWCVALAEALLGHHPFIVPGEQPSLHELQRRVIAGEMIDFELAGLPKQLSNVLKRGMSSSCDDRFETLQQLLDELAAVVREPERRSQSGRTSKSARPWMLVLSGLLATGGVTGAALLWGLGTSTSPEGQVSTPPSEPIVGAARALQPEESPPGAMSGRLTTPNAEPELPAVVMRPRARGSSLPTATRPPVQRQAKPRATRKQPGETKYSDGLRDPF